jgi:DNA-binding response OmpR family regulator
MKKSIVLVIECETAAREQITQGLEKDGYRVIVAEDIKEGERLLRMRGLHINTIFVGGVRNVPIWSFMEFIRWINGTSRPVYSLSPSLTTRGARGLGFFGSTMLANPRSHH